MAEADRCGGTGLATEREALLEQVGATSERVRVEVRKAIAAALTSTRPSAGSSPTR